MALRFLYLLVKLQPGSCLNPIPRRCPRKDRSNKSLYQPIFSSLFPRWQGVEGWSLVGVLAPGPSLNCLHPTLGLLHLDRGKVLALPEAHMLPNPPPPEQQACGTSAALQMGPQAPRSPPGPSEWTLKIPYLLPD